jgi:group I intron endonuclease
MIGIYKITNMVNRKVYIGQSTNIKRRWKDHKKDAFWENNPEYEYPLYRAMRKYGIDSFSFEVIEECSKEELNEKEKLYIAQYDSYKNGYNQTEGGDSGVHNLKLPQQEVLEIIRRLKTTKDNIYVIAQDFDVGPTTIHYINKGEQYYQPNEIYPIRPHLMKLNKQENESKGKTKYQCPICGNPVSERNNLCKSCSHKANRKVDRPEPLVLAKMIKDNGFENTGRILNVSGKTISNWCKIYNIPHHKKELITWYNEQMGISESELTRKRFEDRMKPVNQISSETRKIINTFKSACEAGRYLGKSNGNHISEACRGLLDLVYGYRWEFAR